MHRDDVFQWGTVSRLALPALLLGALLLGGCSDDDDDGGGGGGSGIVVHAIPGFGAFYWRTDGGSAVGQTGRNGGNGGDVDFSADGGVGPDDGRPRPTPATNFLTPAELGDNLGTYTELTGLQAPVIVGTVATFNLPAGTGFNLPAGATLNLSDATAGVVDSVMIVTDDIVRISGPMLTTRSGAASVSLGFTSTQIGGPSIVVEGSLNGVGDAGFSGGNFYLYASYGTLIAFGTVNVSGGAATAALDAGSGGDIEFSAGQDLLIPYGSVSATGGHAEGNAGGGGDFNLSASHSLTQVNVWGALLDGGNGNAGNGGSAGEFESGMGGHTNVAVRFSGNGGNTNGSGTSAGSGGFCNVVAADATGIVYGTANAGSVITGGASGGGEVFFGGYYGRDVELRGSVNGGTGPDGGNGGFMAIHFSNARGALLAASAHGGNGVTNGGDAGVIALTGFDGSDLNLQLARIEGGARGGNATASGGDAGFGGNILLGYEPGMSAAPPVNATAVELYGNADGGDAPDGNAGRGGWIGSTGAVSSIAGFLLRGTANGGTSNTGGAGQGGRIGMIAQADAHFDAVIDAEARGGDATGTADGGSGGLLEIHASSINGNYGSARLRMKANIRGGNAVNGNGGTGGEILFSNAGGGSFVAEHSAIDAQGGDSQTGDGGYANSMYANFDGPASFVGGYINTGGGNGATVSGNGNGGDGADNMEFASTGYSLILSLNLYNNGGSAGGTGNGGGGDNDIRFYLDQVGGNGAYLELRGILETRGGDARGTGAGGQAGEVDVNDAGAILVEATINCSGGNSVGGAGGGTYTPQFQCDGPLVFRGVLTANGGNGATTGGAGATVNIGEDTTGEVIIERTAVIRANGGSGATGGNGGTINLNPAGTGGATNTNLREEPGAIYEVLGGATGGSDGTITRD